MDVQFLRGDWEFEVNSSAKGARQERRAMKSLEQQGYQCTKAGASLGVFDIVAIHPTHVRLIQVKSNRRPRSHEMELIEEFPCPMICSKEVWVYKDRVRDPIVEIVK